MKCSLGDEGVAASMKQQGRDFSGSAIEAICRVTDAEDAMRTGFIFAPAIACKTTVVARQDELEGVGTAPLRGQGDGRGKRAVRVGATQWAGRLQRRC